MEPAHYRPEDLKKFCQEVFEHLGMGQEDADVVSDSLVRANLEGTDSHGVSRMGIYTNRMQDGRIFADPNVEIEHNGSVLRVDGGNGLGQIASYHALKAALPVARETGIAGVGVRNSNHFGAAAYYCRMACREGMALIATTNSPPGIAPWGGKKAYFGTNPIAFGFPTRNEPPVIVDMSSSVVARGNIINAAREREPIPEGWATDEEGEATTDAEAALKGAMLPLGGAKGYALALAIEVMSGVLSGAAFGPHVNNLYKDNDPPADVGHSFILMDVSCWLDLDDYYDRMDQILNEIKTSPRAKDVEGILYPGERRYGSYLDKMEEGIALPDAVSKELEELARVHKVSFPSPKSM